MEQQTPRYTYLTFPLAGIQNDPFLLLSRFKKLLETASPEIPPETVRAILTWATSLDIEHLLEVVHATVTVPETADLSIEPE